MTYLSKWCKRFDHDLCLSIVTWVNQLRQHHAQDDSQQTALLMSNEGLLTGVLEPFQNCPVFAFSQSFSLFIPCLTYLLTNLPHNQHSPSKKIYRGVVAPVFPIFFFCSPVFQDPRETLTSQPVWWSFNLFGNLNYCFSCVFYCTN